MKNGPDEKLDGLLQRWAESRAPTDEQLAELRERVSSTVGTAAFVDIRPMPRPHKGHAIEGHAIAGRVAWFCLGAAAAVFVACLLWPEPQAVSPGAVHVPREQENGIPEFATMKRDELRARAVLLEEMENLFPGQLRWVAESGDKVSVGLLSEAMPAVRKTAPVAIRMVVVSRKTSRRDWTPVWMVDIVSRGEEVVALTPESSGAGELLLWTYPMSDKMVAVDGSIALPDPKPVHSSFSGIQEEGTTKAVLSVQADDVEYRVFQTVTVMDGKVG